jgi:Bacterial regulatory helix-turn-helix protein, lysR family
MMRSGYRYRRVHIHHSVNVWRAFRLLMNLRGFDLNLLVILGAVLRERSVSKAAEQLGMSQSAVSHALGRLRLSFDDPLLFRKDGVMEPTWRALAIADTIRAALAQIDNLLNMAAAFDPASARREFVLRASDYVAAMLLPGLSQALRTEAPGVRLEVRHFPIGMTAKLWFPARCICGWPRTRQRCGRSIASVWRKTASSC